MSILLYGPGQSPYPARLSQVGFTVTLQRGAHAQHYTLSGIDLSGRLVYRLVEPRPARVAQSRCPHT